MSRVEDGGWVYRLPNTKTSPGPDSWTSDDGATQAYHADRDCQHIRNKPDSDVWELPARAARRRGLSPCDRCVLDRQDQAKNWPEHQSECPLCGEVPSNQLASHIREDH